LKRRPSALAAAALVLVFAAAGCGKSSSPSAPRSVDAITITTISPASGTQLHPGTSVPFAATIQYSLVSAATGTVTLVYEDQNGVILNSAAQVSKTVNAGMGSVTLSDTVKVPATGVTTLFVFFPLLPAGATGTNTAVTATYPVG
jgi:multidrug efflux pump subunit AcrA (membrane-fusion protein)